MGNYFYHNFLMKKNVIFIGLTIITNIYKILLKREVMKRARMIRMIRRVKITIYKYITIMY
jgi:hypothetical protein